ncbi:MAG TPA: ScyD/ScyE family protein [Anaerolineales bacterium]|nr:ScyD/ScyE family protein [Anaerolineales bacterium]
MNRKFFVIALVLSFVIVLASTSVVAAKNPSAEPNISLLASGLEGASGSTIGPDGALYVTEGAAGRVSRVDPQTGNVTTYAEGLPPAILPIGGANDLVFMDGTAYVLVTMVGDDLPVPVNNGDVVGIYRIDGPNSYTIIADIGTWSINNPSQSVVFIPSGVHYAIDTFRGGFLVTDGHHNRVLYVTLDGEVSEMLAFGNIVPTGLEVHGNTVFMAEAGPNPHLPVNGKVVTFGPKNLTATEVASGAPLLVDVEYGLGQSLYALAQGDFPVGAGDGSPADPNTGKLVEVNEDGTFTTIMEGLNQPTSMEFIGNTAYIISLAGDIYKIENVSNPPFGK